MGEDDAPRVRRIGRRRVTTSTGDERPEPREDPADEPASEDANDERLRADRPPHWG